MSEKALISPRTGKPMKISSGPVGQNATPGSIAFNIFNYLFVTAVAVITILPFIYLVGASLCPLLPVCLPIRKR